MLAEFEHLDILTLHEPKPPGRLQIGIQGGRGSFNETALQAYLATRGIQAYDTHYLYTSENVLAALGDKSVDYGQVAVYNMIGGFVDETIEAMKTLECRIVGGFSIKITHALMIQPDADITQITEVMSQPQVFAQCRGKMAAQYPYLKQVTGEGDLMDSAMVACQLSENKLPKHIAVMGNPALATCYHLKLVTENLQDHPNNYTSFLHIARVEALNL